MRIGSRTLGWRNLIAGLALVSLCVDATGQAPERVRSAHHAGSHGTAIAASPGLPHKASVSPAHGPNAMRSLIGRVQMVRFDVPQGTIVEIATSNGVAQVTNALPIGLMVGPTYRLRVHYSSEKGDLTLYPTIRFIGYTVPPAHIDPSLHPVPVRFVDRDFQEAAEGQMLTNVMYLEDPLSALPIAFPHGDLPVLESGPHEDPLVKASGLGRPMAIIQMGNRVPLEGRFEEPQNDPPIHFGPVASPTVAPVATSASGIQMVGWTTPAAPPAIKRMAGGHLAPLCKSCPPISREPYKVHPRMPHDEYLCDGGDDVPYAHLDAYNTIVGLGSSETAGVFTRPGEKPRLTTSNQVCLYAPRFGLMRSSTAPVSGMMAEGPRGVDHRLRRAAIETRMSLDQRRQNEQTKALRRREQIGRVAMHEPLAAIDELRIIDAFHQREGSTHSAALVGLRGFAQADEARLALGIQAAIPWNRVEYPAYTALVEGGGQITGYARTGEVQQVKEPDLAPGELVLCKTASSDHAQQGDIVEFAIYYRNVGQRPLESISIIDSLTARLEYVPDSARTDRRAVFTATGNDVESHELRWDILDPLPAGESGVVWFRAKVR